MKAPEICIFDGCSALLGDEGKAYGACSEHRLCKDCGLPLAAPELAYCARLGFAPQHARCMAISKPASTDDSPITMTVAHLDRLNMARLLVEPVTEWSPETNSKDAEYKTFQYVHTMTLEQKFLFLRRLEAVTAQTSVLLKKDRKAIELQLNERAKADAVQRAKPVLKAKPVQGEVLRTKTEGGLHVVISPEGQQTTLTSEVQAKSLEKSLKNREKALAGLMAVGLTREAAIAVLDGVPKEEKKA